MNIYSKSVEVGARKINATWTKEMYEDLKNFKSWDEIMKEEEKKRARELRKQKLDRLNDLYR